MYISAKRVCAIVFESVLGKALAVCPDLKKVLFSRESSPSVVGSCNLCSLDSVVCGSRGRRLKFEGYGIDSLRVIWVCPKVTDLSFLRSGVDE